MGASHEPLNHNNNLVVIMRGFPELHDDGLVWITIAPELDLMVAVNTNPEWMLYKHFTEQTATLSGSPGPHLTSI